MNASHVDPVILGTLVIYLLALAAVAIYCKKEEASRKGTFIEKYFIGGRSMGAFLLALTLVATYTSGSSFLGGPGMAYKMGLGWVLLSVVQIPTALLALGVLGKRFAIIGRRIGAVTLNDILRARYESPWVVFLGAFSVLVFFVAAMSAQFVAGGRLFEATTGLPYATSLFLFAGTVILYTTLGGFRAVVVTDLIQGVVMLIGTMMLLFVVTVAGGGMGNITQTLEAIDPALLTPGGPDGFIAKPFILSFWILVGLGTIGLPFTAVRCMGYKDSRSLHRGIVISTVVLALLIPALHLTGALGRAVVPGLTVTDRVIPDIAIKLLPSLLVGVFMAAPLAAIMSTVDSQLILASAAIVKDIWVNTFHANTDLTTKKMEKKLRLMSFFATAFLGLLPFFIAISPPSIIVWINLFAFGGLEAAFLFPTVFGLYWRRANAPGALASMICGVAAFILLSLHSGRFYGVHPIVPSLAFAGAVFVVVSLATAPPSKKAIELFWGKSDA